MNKNITEINEIYFLCLAWQTLGFDNHRKVYVVDKNQSDSKHLQLIKCDSKNYLTPLTVHKAHDGLNVISSMRHM